mgnify:CR=1 FL=1
MMPSYFLVKITLKKIVLCLQNTADKGNPLAHLPILSPVQFRPLDTLSPHRTPSHIHHIYTSWLRSFHNKISGIVFPFYL